MPLPQIYRNQDTSDLVLKRFLGIFGKEFSYLKSKAAYMSTILDVTKCDVQFLPYYAYFLGVDLYMGMTADQIRKAILGAVYTYSYKGTLPAITNHIQNLTGWTVYVVEKWVYWTFNGNPSPIVWSNTALNPPLTSAQAITAYNLLNPNWLADSNPYNRLLILALTNGDANYTLKTNLLNKTLPKQVPAGIVWSFCQVN